MKFFCKKIWWNEKVVIPLHSQPRKMVSAKNFEMMRQQDKQGAK